MKDTFLLYLTDKEVILYQGSSERIATFTGSFKEIIPALETHLPSKASLRLVIDRTQQDLHEEKLPPLFFWDRARLLFHKKASWSLEGGYAGAQFLKQDGSVYLRWSHFSQKDPIAFWIAFVKARSGYIFFVSLEAMTFLRTQLIPSKDYHLLLYTAPSHTPRHMVFKGKRLLLSRLSHGEEDLKGSLHFLSRTYADIHDNLEVLQCDAHDLINFLSSQKQASFPLSEATLSYSLWVKRSIGVFLSFICLWSGVELYEGVRFKHKTPPLLSEAASLKEASQELTSRLKNQDAHILQRSVTSYQELTSHQRDPLQDVERLSSLLKMYPFYLESVEWQHEQPLEILLTFLMEKAPKREVLTAFESVLASAHEHFPRSQIQVLEAPFKSGAHETFTGSAEDALPRVRLKIVDP